jgi:AmmeMemoRadiSam system protein B
MQREMSVRGTFYPSRALELERYFEHFSRVYDEASTLPDIKSRAVIVPHAGYVYSGYTANIAYRVLQKSGIKTFVVIGPSHRVAYEGVSLCDFGSYDTPFAPIAAATKLTQSLKERFFLPCHLEAHAEHSTEVQFPFVKYYMEDASIVELVYSRMEPHALSQIIDFLLSKEDVGVIISTDLSHFYTLKEASKLDAICLEAVKELDVGLLHNGCEACGHIGVEAMLLSAKKLGLHPHILDYRTSADASDDTSRVVGYVSACFV